MSFTNYYIVLGVKNTASFEEIKAAYRALAKKYHPDKNADNKAAEDFFKEVQQAYAVLSNPEKRKKFDLKFNYSSQQKQSTNHTAYRGNAYQYAQQEAYYKKQYQNTQTKGAGSVNKKKDPSEKIQIAASIVVAIILLSFIISYSSEDSKKNNSVANKHSIKIDEPFHPEELTNIAPFDSPYTYFFGDEISDIESMNNITVHTSSLSEAIVCLINSDNNKTIRNQYIGRHSTFKLNNIPNGNYFLKVYYGNNWKNEKIINDRIKGGFEEEIRFVKLNTNKDMFKMKQQQQGASIAYSSYEINLDPYQKKNVKTITTKDFFCK